MPRETGRWYFDARFKLCARKIALHSKLPLRIVVRDLVARSLPNQFEAHQSWRTNSAEGGPFRLIHYFHIFHLQRSGFSVWADNQPAFRNSNDPVKSRRGDRGMKVVDLVLRSSLLLKQR